MSTGRALMVRRATVPAAAEAAYLAMAAELRRLAALRGAHRWLFRRPGDGGTFLEFHEGPAGMLGALSSDERALEHRFAALAEHAAGADEVWDEVTL